jgi:hypothetical protein
MLIEEYRTNLLNFASGISLQGTYSPDSESIIALPPMELLWLATCTARYIAETGDESILNASVAGNHDVDLTLGEHCERIIRMCIQDDKAHNSLLAKTVRLWSLMNKDAKECKIQLSTIFKASDDDDKHPEERSLPRRLRYFQSVSPVLNELPLMREIESLFDNDGALASETGVACCLYSTLVEQILGIEATNGGLIIKPNLPKSWQECKITRLFRNDIYNIHLKRAIIPTKKGGSTIIIDGEPALGNMLPYFDDTMEHNVEVMVT